MDVATDLSHVSEAVRPIVSACDKERIRFIRNDLFIPHPYVQPILNEIQGIVTDPSGRAKGVAVMGTPNSGKSMLLKEMQRRWGAQVPLTDPESPVPHRQPMIVVTMTDAYRTEEVYGRIYQALLGPECSGSAGRVASEYAVVNLLKRVQCQLLGIDEFSDILKGNPSEQRRVLGAIKYVMNEGHVRVAALGTHEMEGAFLYDQHLSQRFTRFRLPEWKVNKNFQILVKAMQRNLPLHCRSSLLAVESLRALVDLGNGVLGNIVRLVQDAAIEAIIDGTEYVDEKLIRQVAKRRPDYVRVT